VPSTPPDLLASGRRELSAFKNLQVWLTLLVGAVGFGGMFAMYSYIAPTVTDVTGQSASMVPVFLFSFGLGAFGGTWLGGRLADWSVLRSLVLSAAAMGSTLALFSWTAHWLVAGLVTVFVVSAAGGVLVVNLQLRLMRVAGRAQTLGAVLNHSSLNIGNALGAWLGGLVIAAGWGYPAASWVGAGLSLAGLLILAVSVSVHRRSR
jgi:DHA1 family inner membrane transport protein